MGIRWVFASAVLALSASLAVADGMYFEKIGKEVRPTIPYQRALVSYRDGRETLIVESTLNAPEGEYAWIVPLPAEPTDMTATTPGVLQAAVTLSPPENLVESYGKGLAFAIPVFVLVVLVAAWGLCRRRERSAKAALKQLAECGAAAGLGLLIGFVIGGARQPPDEGKADAAGPPAVQVLQQQTLGSYETAVVKGRDSGALAQWLNTHGFRLPDEAKPIIDRYVTDGWCFMAARLRTEGGRTATPHPLKVTFQTDRAVYPMRLTALSGRPLLLDVFVVGERYGVVPGLDPWASTEQYGSVKDINRETLHPYSHPGLAAAMWDGAAVTRYRGTMAPADMDDDLWIGWRDAPPASVSVWKPAAAWQLVFTWGLFVFAILFSFWSAWAVLPPGRLGLKVLEALAVSAACAFGAAAVTMPAHISDFRQSDEPNSGGVQDAVAAALDELRADPPGRDFPSALRQRVAERARDLDTPVTAPIPEIDVPGGYLVRPAGKGWTVTSQRYWEEAPVVWLVDENGRPEGQTPAALGRKKAEWARKLGVDQEDIELDPTTGNITGFRGEFAWERYMGPGDKPKDAETVTRLGQRWADRLGLEKTRFLVKWELGANVEGGTDAAYASVEFQLGRAGYPVLDSPDTASITFELETGKLTHFYPLMESRDFDPPAVSVQATDAVRTAVAVAKRGTLGRPLAGKSRLGYVDMPRDPTKVDEWLGRPRRARLAWRTLFEEGRVDVDAESGKVIAVESKLD